MSFGIFVTLPNFLGNKSITTNLWGWMLPVWPDGRVLDCAPICAWYFTDGKSRMSSCCLACFFFFLC